jgi:choline transport protein
MTIVWAIVITVFFCFPTSLPVTGGNMSMSNIDPPLCSSTNECCLDYAAVVLVVMLILGVINWFVYARKWYHGPRLEL